MKVSIHTLDIQGHLLRFGIWILQIYLKHRNSLRRYDWMSIGIFTHLKFKSTFGFCIRSALKHQTCRFSNGFVVLHFEDLKKHLSTHRIPIKLVFTTLLILNLSNLKKINIPKPIQGGLFPQPQKRIPKIR